MEPHTTPAQRLAMSRDLAVLDRDSVEVQTIAREARAVADPEVRAALILRRVQALPFRPDPPGEWVQGAVETLKHGGDCEDLSSLAALLGVESGLGGRTMWIAQPNRPRDHVTALLKVNGSWRWAEPTLRGALVGESPYRAQRRLGVQGGL